MILRRRKSNFPWRSEYSELAQFNTEVSRGLVHTQDKQARMEELQKEYNKEITQYYERQRNPGMWKADDVLPTTDGLSRAVRHRKVK